MLKQTFKEFLDDDAPRMAAALSYYTVFSLPPLLVLILLLTSVFVEPGEMQGRLQQEISGVIGPEAGRQIAAMIENANRPGSGGILPTLLGIAALLFGATGAFSQLQKALNQAWEVEPDPEQGGVKAFVMKRVMSFGMIVMVAFLLLVSLVLSAAISAAGDALGGFLPGGISGVVLQVMELATSVLVITLVFAALFKVLPDAVIAWKDVGVGAAVTALLFVLGKFLLGFYLSKSDPGSAYGAAGSLAVILVWIYYSSMILFLGAEFTQVWARRKGKGIEPEEGAHRVRELQIRDDGPLPAPGGREAPAT